MNPWFAKAAILASSLVMVIIRAPHGRRSPSYGVAFALLFALRVGPEEGARS
jgi:hypothetical protein